MSHDEVLQSTSEVLGKCHLWHPRGVLVELPLPTSEHHQISYKRIYDGVEHALSMGFLLAPPSVAPPTATATATAAKPKEKKDYNLTEWIKEVGASLAGCENAEQINALVDGLRKQNIPEKFKDDIRRHIEKTCSDAGFTWDKHGKFYKP